MTAVDIPESHEAPPAPAGVHGELQPVMEKPEPAVVAYWRVAGTVGALLFFGIIALQGLFFLMSDSPQTGMAVAAVAGTLGVLRIGWVLVTTRLRYRNLAFSVGATNLSIRHGILVHREKTIPIARLQHLDVDRGPLERLFGLASLSVFTSGGRAATYRIAGLSPARAEAMRTQVLAHAASDDDR